MSTETVDNNLWLDDEFSTTLLKSDKGEPIEEPQAMIAPDLNPQVITNIPEPEPEPVAPQPQYVQEVEPDEPEVIENPDGSSIRIEKSSKGWKGTVDIGYGSTQVFYGKTKNELLKNLMVAQLNATKKIREQNKKIKLGTVEEAPTVQQVERQTGRKLTADEVFEIKTLMESDPDKALDTWFEKRTGQAVDALVQKVDKGQAASNALEMESVNKEFLAACPGYYPDQHYENFNSLITYLAKHKLRRGRRVGDESQILEALVIAGHYTASNLEEAYEELTEAGLLIKAPRPPENTPAPEPKENTGRIVQTQTRPRAGLGIRSSEVTQTRIPEPTPPTDQDFNTWSTEDIDKAIADQRRAYIASLR